MYSSGFLFSNSGNEFNILIVHSNLSLVQRQNEHEYKEYRQNCRGANRIVSRQAEAKPQGTASHCLSNGTYNTRT